MSSGKLLLLITVLLLSGGVIRCQQSLPAIPVIRSDATDGVVKGKSTVNLYCDVENADSEITWYHRGELVGPSNSLSVTISGGVHDTLTIPVFRSKRDATSHAGDWQCSRDGLISKRLELSKARIKQFSDSIKDVVVNVIEGSTALLPCEPPTGRPRADTVFEINGATIDESRGRFYLLSSGDLQIANVRPSDNGTYRCVAINRVLRDKVPAPNKVTLNVLSRAGQLTSKPRAVAWSQGSRVTIVEGDELSLPCVFGGNPLPSIEWAKYLATIPLNRSETLPTNTLVIKDVEFSDSGTYNCAAENALSAAPVVQTYTVDVLRIPRIVFPVRELYREEGTTITFNCSLEQGQLPGVTYEWYHNGDKLAGTIGNSSASVQIMQESLRIFNVTPAHAGMYQCLANIYDVGQDSSYIKFYVEKPHVTTTTTATTTTPTTTPSTPVPSRIPPSVPVVEQVRREGFRLTWSIASNDQVMSFRIKMKKGSDDWIVKVRDLARQETSTEINSGLVPGMKYRFIVVALYRGRVEVESSPSERVKLSADFGENETTPATDLTRSATIIQPPANTVTSPSAQSNLTINQASECSSEHRPPRLLRRFHDMIRTAGRMVDFNCLGDTCNETYTWYKDGVRQDEVPGSTFILNERLRLVNAQPMDNGLYSCSVRNPYGFTNHSAYFSVQEPNPQRVTSEVRRPPAMTTAISEILTTQAMIPPRMPNVTIISSYEVHLEWRPVTEGLAVKFYKIQYRLLGYAKQKWYTMDGTVEDVNFYRIANLKPGAAYKFRIAAMYINDNFKFSDATARIRLPTNLGPEAVLRAPQAVPRLTAVRQTANDTLLASWVYNGVTPIDNFIVQYQRFYKPGHVMVAWTEHRVRITNDDDKIMNQAAITNLEPNESYLIRVLAENAAGRGEPGNMSKRLVVVPFVPRGILPPPTATTLPSSGEGQGVKVDGEIVDQTKVSSSDSKAGGSDMLYIILGAALGSMVLLLIVFVAICGFKQRQQRRAMLAVSRGSQNKFADASKVLYGEQLKQSVNGSAAPNQFVTLSNGGVGHGVITSIPLNGTLTSVNSHRMSLNINPLNELDETFTNGTLRDAPPQEHMRGHNGTVDYNLMQHYPHYNNSGSRRHTPTMPYHHHSHHSIDAGSHHDGSIHCSQGSLPHYNVHQQHDRSRSGTPQFSTFLPRQNPDDPSAPVPASKLPHPQGLRPMHYGQGPVQSAFEPPQNSQQRRRRKKRSQHNRDHIINQSSGGSGVEYNTNTDLSSGEGTGAEDYNQMLPPPPLLPSSYGESAMPREHQPLADSYRERSNSDNAVDTLDSNADHVHA